MFLPRDTAGPAAPHIAAPDPATGRLVAGVLERLEALIGLAPGDVPRRRLERRPELLEPAMGRAPAIEDEAWAAVIDAVTVQETRLFRHPVQMLRFRAQALPALLQGAAARGAARLRLLSAGCATGE